MKITYNLLRNLVTYCEKMNANDYFRHMYQTINFRKNVNCVENINSSFNRKDETSDYIFLLLATLIRRI